MLFRFFLKKEKENGTERMRQGMEKRKKCICIFINEQKLLLCTASNSRIIIVLFF